MGGCVDAVTLARAETQAYACGVDIHEVLLATGIVSGEDYATTLAMALGVPLAGWNAELDIGPAPENPATDAAWLRWGGPPEHVWRVLAADEAPPSILRDRISALRSDGVDVMLAPGHRVRDAVDHYRQARRIHVAVRGLLDSQPDSSAAQPLARWQLLWSPVVTGMIIGGIAVFPDAAYFALAALLSLPFLGVAVLRSVALHRALMGPARSLRAKRLPQPRCPDALLPRYTVLVPLFREAGMLPGLVRSLAALDYPVAKLDVVLVIEAADLDTQAALLNLALPGNFRVLIVPDHGPRTKPKALNYALQLAHGDFIVVYDAEDRPQRDQLRRAWEVFRNAPNMLGCLQAQLNIYNPWHNWMTRQFTIEYSALFDAILPALERLRLPVPLGGTSNHFPRSTLVGVGGWDPHNVTEDADLGIRLARQGYYTGVLSSTTWEEAPPAFGIWFRQRTRWLKGWMLPCQLECELGNYNGLTTGERYP